MDEAENNRNRQKDEVKVSKDIRENDFAKRFRRRRDGFVIKTRKAHFLNLLVRKAGFWVDIKNMFGSISWALTSRLHTLSLARRNRYVRTCIFKAFMLRLHQEFIKTNKAKNEKQKNTYCNRRYYCGRCDWYDYRIFYGHRFF